MRDLLIFVYMCLHLITFVYIFHICALHVFLFIIIMSRILSTVIFIMCVIFIYVYIHILVFLFFIYFFGRRPRQAAPSRGNKAFRASRCRGRLALSFLYLLQSCCGKRDPGSCGPSPLDGRLRRCPPIGVVPYWNPNLRRVSCSGGGWLQPMVGMATKARLSRTRK